MSKQAKIAIRGAYALLFLLFALLPIWFTLIVALTPNQQLIVDGLFPKNPTLENFEAVLSGAYFPFWRWFVNSLGIAISSSVLLVIMTSLMGFAFSRLRFRGRTLGLTALFFLNTVPTILTLVATFSLMSSAGEYVPWLGFNSPVPIVFIYVATGLVVNTYLVKGYFDTIPKDLDEAAILDGAPRWKIFLLIIMPLARPMLMIVFLLGFIAYFNDYIIALTFLKQPESQTLAVGLNNFVGANTTAWGRFAAGAILSSLPVMLLVVLARNYITTGLMGGATKG